MQEYEINDKTLAVLPYNYNQSIVYEGKDCFILEKPVSKIMDNSCKYYGSTMEGRQKGATALTGINYKVPIIVSEENNVIFFPTTSPRLKECSWISLNNINKYYLKEDKIILEFLNKEKLELSISENILKNQILRAALLESAIKKRSKKQ
ncbi:MAG: competence protein ComK [Bacilli bacterium]|nr:competence protein ComK [Bacilli bacterium]